MAQKPLAPMVDLVSIVISPILIMMMVGSLVFFLIEVLYAGQYQARLLYTMFFFVIGAVLIARIGIVMGQQRAGLYTLLLGGAAFLAMLRFVEYPNKLFQALGPIINILLMTLIWWVSRRLTWDCTYTDVDQKASGRGLLAAAGMENSSSPEEQDLEEYSPRDRSEQVLQKNNRKNKRKKQDTPGLISWWERLQQYRQQQKHKPHTPGVWITYFALAAIPLFALGQAVIPADDASRRSATFWQMVVYIGSALGLLMTTSLLGLRNYLQERNAPVPYRLTIGWLTVGTIFIALFLGVGALLPRPHAETSVLDWSASSQKRNASKNALVKDQATGEGEGEKGNKSQASDEGPAGKKGKQKTDGKSNQSGGQKNNSKNQGDQSGSPSKDGNKDGKDQESKKSQDNNQQGPSSSSESKDQEQSEQASEENSSTSSSSSSVTRTLESIASGVKWIVWILLALAVIVGIVWFCLRGLAPFTDWAKSLLDWFRNLFAKKTASTHGRFTSIESAPQTPPPSFSEYSNPFADGSASQRDPEELLEYTMNALVGWGWDHGIAHDNGETAREFMARIIEEFPEFEAKASTLLDLYDRVLFSSKPLPDKTLALLRDYWQLLDQFAVVSAR